MFFVGVLPQWPSVAKEKLALKSSGIVTASDLERVREKKPWTAVDRAYW